MADHNNRDRYFSITGSLSREEIQPTARRNDTNHSTFNHDVNRRSRRENIQTDLSTTKSKNCWFPHLVPSFIQQQTTHLAVTMMEDDETVSNCAEMQGSLSQTNRRRTAGEPKTDLRIERDTMCDIMDEIESKTFDFDMRESSLIFFKGIGRLSNEFTDLKTQKEANNTLLLLNSLEDFAKRKGCRWKKIRIQECSPQLFEALLASPISINFEEIHIERIRHDEHFRPNDNQFPSDRAELPSESQLQSTPSLRDSQNQISSLIISLLKNTTRIKHLVLKDCNLDNMDLIRIMNFLCGHPRHSESLVHLDLRFNKFTPIAIQSVLGVHLRKSLHSLKTVKLRQGIRCVVHRSIRDAILQSLRCSRVILESIDIFDWDKSVQYLLDINRAKRRFIFCNNDRFPRSLWPLLLEQALAMNEEDHFNALGTGGKKPSRHSLFPIRRNSTSTTTRQASVVYHIFRNGGPMLLQQQHPSVHFIDFELH